MPLYEYRCQKCGQIFEQMRPMSQADCPTKCPACRSEDVQRKVAVMGRAANSSNADCGVAQGF
jgi:putative FmdB family regulatory protein